MSTQHYRNKRSNGNQAQRDSFLPVSRADMDHRGWDRLDVLLVSGDAYVDHPAFGVPLLARLLDAHGFRVGIVAQPRWDVPDDFARLGRPRLFCGISAGSLDSMLAHYTAFRKKRGEDACTPGGKPGARPNRAAIVYSHLARRAFPGLPLVLGGIEASLRRAVHYDFWSDHLRRGILFDAKGDLLVTGMGERAVLEIARRLRDGREPESIPGTAVIRNTVPAGARPLPSLADIRAEPRRLLTATLALEEQVHRGSDVLVQAHGSRSLVLHPPAPPLEAGELERLYELPFTRQAHPDYPEPVPALDMIRWSITALRGCGGGCTFCSLALHQGRHIRSRSRASVLREVKTLTRMPGWKGSVSDIGGPTANLWGASCERDEGACGRTSCLFPRRCPNLHLRQDAYLALLRAARKLPGVKHVRMGSGIRHDIAIEDPEFCRGLIGEFTGGQLKVAPEHSAEQVLKLMRKTDFSLFQRFRQLFAAATREAAKEQYIVPYIMTAFPGCRKTDMRALAAWFREQGWRPRQVQCFVPTPGTVATAMFYGGCDLKGDPIHVARTDRERLDQHSLLVPRV